MPRLVTAYPGLIGSLPGVNFAKGLCSFVKQALLCGVHHLRSHIESNYITHADLEPPLSFLCLVVSGGKHPDRGGGRLYKIPCTGKTRMMRRSASTRPPAPWEMSYPGGVELDIVAEKGDPSKYKPQHLRWTEVFSILASGT